jgi:hypothetical protein
MKRFWQCLVVILLLAPLTLSAETISWILPTTYTDGSAISAADKARITVYLRGYKAGNLSGKTYFGETRNGGTSWGVAGDNTYIMNKMNEWGAANAVPGWVVLKPGDNVLITTSAAITWTDNGVTKEFDGPESPPYAYIIPVPFPTATFSAAPEAIVKGSCSTLSWSSSNATVASIEPGIGSVATTGTQSVCPTATTQYTLMVMGAGGTEVKTTTVTVTQPPPPPTPSCSIPIGITITR